ESLDAIMVVDPAEEAATILSIEAWRAQRDETAVAVAIAELERVARSSDAADNIMIPTIALAKAGGTTGEWAGTLRAVWGEYRAPTGVSGAMSSRGAHFADLVTRSESLATRRGSRPKLLVAKPGLDGHSNGAEQIAVAARDAGFEVVYQGIRLSPEEIVAAARDEDVDLVGISILSGSHLSLVPRIITGLRDAGADAQVIVGGIIPDEDAAALLSQGVARVYTPKNFQLATIMSDLLDLVESRFSAS
ncbi:MAG: methylmalonyl-CoA mutase family protein, partial [Actinomycetes bacterium]